MQLPQHPTLFQINTRLLLDRLRKVNPHASLGDIPKSYWKFIADRGTDLVWLMGLWHTNESGFERILDGPGDLAYYQSVLPDLQEEDLAGSPYAIDKYSVAPALGDADQLKKVRKVLHKYGMRLIVDFIPNHFGAHSSVITSTPELFVHGTMEQLEHHPRLFFRADNGHILAHGKDPYFDPWQDTVQVDYSKESTRRAMIRMLKELASVVDGVRCDMAMLLVRRVFQENWGAWTDQMNFNSWNREFWEQAITEVKEKYPDFLFIAECYWGMEGEMQYYGFDYTYDKVLLDKLKDGNPFGLQDHLKADFDYQRKSVRFLENHDEERAAVAFPERKHQAAAVLSAALPGMRFYHLGQSEGRRIKVPVQINRNPPEKPCQDPLQHALKRNRIPEKLEPLILPVCISTSAFYEKLFSIFNAEVFKNGVWNQFYLHGSPERNTDALFCFSWNLMDQQRLVVVNYSERDASGSLNVSEFNNKPAELHGLLFDEELTADSDGALHFQLQPWRSQIYALQHVQV